MTPAPQPPGRTAQLLALGIALAATFAAAAAGGLASAGAGAFYAQLARPAWAPPGWLFGPVWSVLYPMMAVAAWLAWRASPGPAVRPALLLYGAQLAANALWSWLFFAGRQGGWALAEVLLLWVLVLATTVAFWRLRRLAGLLLLPYLAWAGFAGALNFALWRANPGLLGGA